MLPVILVLSCLNLMWGQFTRPNLDPDSCVHAPHLSKERINTRQKCVTFRSESLRCASASWRTIGLLKRIVVLVNLNFLPDLSSATMASKGAKLVILTICFVGFLLLVADATSRLDDNSNCHLSDDKIKSVTDGSNTDDCIPDFLTTCSSNAACCSGYCEKRRTYGTTWNICISCENAWDKTACDEAINGRE